MSAQQELQVTDVNVDGAAEGAAFEEMRAAVNALDAVVQRDASLHDIEWGRSLRDAVRGLFEPFKSHQRFAESEGGSHERLLEAKPNLEAEVRRQHDEHQEILARAETLVGNISEQLHFDETEFDLLKLEGSILRDMVRLHILRDEKLEFESTFQEEGGEEQNG